MATRPKGTSHSVEDFNGLKYRTWRSQMNVSPIREFGAWCDSYKKIITYDARLKNISADRIKFIRDEIVSKDIDYFIVKQLDFYAAIDAGLDVATEWYEKDHHVTIRNQLIALKNSQMAEEALNVSTSQAVLSLNQIKAFYQAQHQRNVLELYRWTFVKCVLMIALGQIKNDVQLSIAAKTISPHTSREVLRQLESITDLYATVSEMTTFAPGRYPKTKVAQYLEKVGEMADEARRVYEYDMNTQRDMLKITVYAKTPSSIIDGLQQKTMEFIDWAKDHPIETWKGRDYDKAVAYRAASIIPIARLSNPHDRIKYLWWVIDTIMLRKDGNAIMKCFFGADTGNTDTLEDIKRMKEEATLENDKQRLKILKRRTSNFYTAQAVQILYAEAVQDWNLERLTKINRIFGFDHISEPWSSITGAADGITPQQVAYLIDHGVPIHSENGLILRRMLQFSDADLQIGDCPSVSSFIRESLEKHKAPFGNMLGWMASIEDTTNIGMLDYMLTPNDSNNGEPWIDYRHDDMMLLRDCMYMNWRNGLKVSLQHLTIEEIIDVWEYFMDLQKEYELSKKLMIPKSSTSMKEATRIYDGKLDVPTGGGNALEIITDNLPMLKELVLSELQYRGVRIPDGLI